MNSANILVVDDVDVNRELLCGLLEANGFCVTTASSGAEALSHIGRSMPHLVLLDIIMPGMSGYEVCRAIRADPTLEALPVVLITALDPGIERVKGLEAGADDFLAKPINQAELLARVRSLLRIRLMHQRLEAQAAELAQLNGQLELRVAQELEKARRLSRLKDYFSPKLAELILSPENETLLDTHRREITVLFCDLRGFTAFSEAAEPEAVMGILSEFLGEMGEEILRFDGTLERVAGDGMMVFFNDPLPCDDPTGQALSMAIAMRTRAAQLVESWRRHEYDLGFGVGVASGFATVGRLGFRGMTHYSAVGTVCNLASRLCDEAKAGQILTNRRTYVKVEERFAAESVGDFELKGLRRPVHVMNVTGVR